MNSSGAQERARGRRIGGRRGRLRTVGLVAGLTVLVAALVGVAVSLYPEEDLSLLPVVQIGPSTQDEGITSYVGTTEADGVLLTDPTGFSSGLSSTSSAGGGPAASTAVAGGTAATDTTAASQTSSLTSSHDPSAGAATSEVSSDDTATNNSPTSAARQTVHGGVRLEQGKDADPGPSTEPNRGSVRGPR